MKRIGTDDAGNWTVTIDYEECRKMKNMIGEFILHDVDWWADTGFDRYAHFNDNKLLFLQAPVYKSSNITERVDAGIVPFPMLNEEQGRYYTPSVSQITTLMCVPKATSDRKMSDYFLDVLAWTGSEYVMEAYCEDLFADFKTDDEKDMILNYIFTSITYDIGAGVGWNALFNSFFNQTYEADITFKSYYDEDLADALEKIEEWNTAWSGYTD